ncbi:uncharacterized protein [Penaeus vannamei]|uniref:uncharacterized protein n=1 Tax=Penaeus vannamei TaxID=6689 RepID=UPI00387F4F29
MHQESLKLRRIPTRIIGLLASLYTSTERDVKHGWGLSSFFPVSSGVRQGCDLSLTLLACIDWILGGATVQSHCGAALGNMKVTNLDFADDGAILSESLGNLVVALDVFSNEARPLGLEVSWTKTKIQDFGYLLGESVWSLQEIEVTESFTYFGSVVHNSGLSDQETVSCALESRLDAFYNRSLHRIMGSCWRDYVSNQRLHCETGAGPVACTICDCQLRLCGHLARFPQDDPAHQVVSVRDKPKWRRPVGRPRKLWLG